MTDKVTLKAIDPGMVQDSIDIFSTVFIFLIGSALLALLVIYIIDVKQRKSNIRRNYPVIGRFRYLFEHLGGFFRQYFFAMDREELPFNRAQRNWAYRAAKNIDTSIAFGTTRNVYEVGQYHFLNAPFPILEEDAKPEPKLVFGPYSAEPYHAPSIVNISGMSYGALSERAVRALSIGAARANCWLNTGEGALSKYHLAGGCDIVFQIGTANYGVRDKEGNFCPNKLRELAQRPQVKMIEIKLAQGAKPGKGGLLPACKVNKEIAETRGIPEGEASVSPNRHKDIGNLEQLLDKIAQVREISGLPVGIKTVIGKSSWVHELCVAIKARGIESAPDFITLDSADGGTGASPQPFMDFVGLTIKESLPILVDELRRHGLKQRIPVLASGKLITPAHASWALAMGADVVLGARGFLFSLGCIQALQCNKNTCPTGITTTDADLQKGLDVENKAERVANYHNNLVKNIEMIAHACGAKHARALSRDDLRIIDAHGMSKVLSEVYPEPVTLLDKP